jgi:hypothetical protein
MESIEELDNITSISGNGNDIIRFEQPRVDDNSVFTFSLNNDTASCFSFLSHDSMECEYEFSNTEGYNFVYKTIMKEIKELRTRNTDNSNGRDILISWFSNRFIQPNRLHQTNN